MMRAAFPAVLSALLAGCAGVSTFKDASTGQGDGLTYFLPRKDVTVSVTRAGGKFTTITIDTTPAYADLTRAYVLNFERNLVGKNKIDIAISQAGLLTSAKSTTTSGVADALTALATSAGTVKGLALPPKSAPTPPKEGETCDTDATHTFVIDVQNEGGVQICGGQFLVSIAPLWLSGPGTVVSSSRANAETHSGVFYRQARPYLVKATGQKLNAAKVVLSPSASPELFLPAARTLFANNEMQFTFEDGVPTKYAQEADGELVALFKLPATVISAYFDAIGAVFGKLSANDKAEAAALKDSVKLELAKQRYELCLAAIRANNTDLISSLKCAE